MKAYYKLCQLISGLKLFFIKEMQYLSLDLNKAIKKNKKTDQSENRCLPLMCSVIKICIEELSNEMIL